MDTKEIFNEVARAHHPGLSPGGVVGQAWGSGKSLLEK